MSATVPYGQSSSGNSKADERAARFKALIAGDAQLRAALALPAIVEAKAAPGLHIAQVVKLIMEGYADRPALGERARELVRDASGRQTLQLLPRFETVSYRQLWEKACAIASEWHQHAGHPLRAGDFVCVLGFASIDYAALILANIQLGGVHVPLQTSAPATQQAGIIAETQPTVLAASIHYLDAAVDAVLLGTAPKRLVVFDYCEQDDDQRARYAAACARLAAAGCATRVDALPALVAHGRTLPAAPLHVPADGADPLAALFYTSGSTGTPKGAMMTEKLVITTWLTSVPMPVITLSFMPMSHLVGNGYLLMTLANGGTSYCSPKSDLSTLFEDLAMVRPTMASLVPRVCEMFYHHYLRETDRRVVGGIDAARADEEVRREMRETLLGGRLLGVGCGSAALAPEIYSFMLSMLDTHMSIGYSSTEIAGGTVLIDGKVQRPPVIDYRLADVPELGYFRTDKPHPRGELCVKSDRFMAGYYKRPDLSATMFDADGYYRTGDVMAEIAPDHLVYVDRRNNVIKLSQGEFVAVSRLEALYAQHAAIVQVYLYGTSERSYLLAVVVPSAELRAQGDDEARAAIRRALQQIADEQRLNAYEVPRDFIVECEPFSLENGLLSGIGKYLRPKLKERYGARLEALYAQLAQDQIHELRALRSAGSDRPVLETVTRAMQATLGVTAGDIGPEHRFRDLGDSLSALELSLLLEEIFGFEVPVNEILHPAADVRRLAAWIESERRAGVRRVSYLQVHGKTGATVRAADLKLDKFIDRATLSAATQLPAASDPPRVVLATGATGYLGRFLALAWLERLAETGGKLICIARGADAAQARARLEDAIASDAALLAHFRTLAEKHLEVLPGDIGLPNLGLDAPTWERLAASVDLIVHPAAHVNHVLPYKQLFAANVGGTAELIRLAISSRRKPIHYVSTLGVNILAEQLVDEDGDVRALIPTCEISRGYANGYNLSKWASEVLLREAFEHCGLPVAVFRPGMILAHRRYAGQLNVPDMFTRLLLSLVATGVAPATFYAEDTSAGRPRARYEGLPVDFLADATLRIGAQAAQGFRVYNMSSPHDDGASLDSVVDWLAAAGCKFERIERYREWLARFETAMRALPEQQRQQSLLALLAPYHDPQHAGGPPSLPTQRFLAATAQAGLEIPHLEAALIDKYVRDLRQLRLL